MYLTKKTYVKNWDHMPPEERHLVTVTKGNNPDSICRPERVSYVIEEVAYWRKANAIHHWFVENCQGGEDDCREAWVRKEQIQELVDLCKQVRESCELVDGQVANGYTYDESGNRQPILEPGKIVADSSLAQELLPSQEGFFFGCTDYDEGYVKDLDRTIEQLQPLLAEADNGFYYSSSW